MSDDPQRPVFGPQSDPRPAAGPPAWWGALGRPDLPLDGEESPEGEQTSPENSSDDPPARPGTRWRTWAFNIAILTVAVLIICLGLGVVSVSMFLTVGLLFGVPLSLAALTALVVARRSR